MRARQALERRGHVLHHHQRPGLLPGQRRVVRALAQRGRRAARERLDEELRARRCGCRAAARTDRRARACGCRSRRRSLPIAGTPRARSAEAGTSRTIRSPRREPREFGKRVAAAGPPTRSSTPPLGGEQLARHLASSNGSTRSPMVCVVSWPLPAISTMSPAAADAERRGDRGAAIEFERQPSVRRTRQDVARDRGRILAARIVARHPRTIGVACRHLAHARALGAIAIAAAAEHQQHAPGEVLAHRRQRARQRIGRVRVVHHQRGTPARPPRARDAPARRPRRRARGARPRSTHPARARPRTPRLRSTRCTSPASAVRSAPRAPHP